MTYPARGEHTITHPARARHTVTHPARGEHTITHPARGKHTITHPARGEHTKGKPRDLDYPACWTGARKCGAEIWRAALSASPPKCKNGGMTGFELPYMSLLRLMRMYLPIRSPISLLAVREHLIWIWSLLKFVFKKRRSPASAGELRMLRTHRRGVCMLSSGPRG